MLREVIAVTALNLRSVPQRWGPSLVIVIGLAGVVAVFIALLALGEGFQRTLRSTGRVDNAIVLRGGSQTELNSGFGRDETTLIKLGPGIRSGSDGLPLAAAEMVVITELPKKDDRSASVNVSLRGVEPASFALRPQLRIVEGRTFTPGLRELLVGRGVAGQFDGVAVGARLRMRGSEWTVVGVFESGDANESELWADVEVAQSTFNRNGFSSVRVGLDGSDGLRTLTDALRADPRLNVDVLSEREYYDGQTEQFRGTIGVLAGVVTVIMALGAIFAALNTMYAAVAARGREVAILRAIGFGAWPVLISVMVEAMALSVLGGLLGAAIAWLLFDNLSVSTLGQNFTQVVFAFQVSAGLVASGLLIALGIGFLGGLAPALRAARLSVTAALRGE